MGAKAEKQMPKVEKACGAKPRKVMGQHIVNHHEGARPSVVSGGRRPPLIMGWPIAFLRLVTIVFFSFWPPFVFKMLPQLVISVHGLHLF